MPSTVTPSPLACFVFCDFSVILIFSGCSFRLASSVDELISPVSPQGDDADVQKALYSLMQI